MDKFKHLIAKTTYLSTWICWYIVFKFFLHYKVEGRKDLVSSLPKNEPILIISNHVAWFDPFMVGVALPNKQRMFPIRWLTKERFFQIPFVGQVIWLYGSLRLKKGIGLDNALREARNILNKRGIVGIFPEGKVRKSGRPRNGRRGVGYLALKTNPTIIPVYIDGAFRVTLKDILLRKKHITIKIGEPLKLTESMKGNPHAFEKASSYLMKKIQELK